MTTPCVYCGKTNCRHTGPATAVAAPTSAPAVRPHSVPPNLFERHGLTGLVCTLCGAVIAGGVNQRLQRGQHGQMHAQTGAVTVRRDPTGALFFILRTTE